MDSLRKGQIVGSAKIAQRYFSIVLQGSRSTLLPFRRHYVLWRTEPVSTNDRDVLLTFRSSFLSWMIQIAKSKFEVNISTLFIPIRMWAQLHSFVFFIAGMRFEFRSPEIMMPREPYKYPNMLNR